MIDDTILTSLTDAIVDIPAGTIWLLFWVWILACVTSLLWLTWRL